MNRQMMALAGGLVLGALVGIQPAMAFPIISGAGNETSCKLGPGTASEGVACETQDISVHDLWQPNDPLGRGAAWVSYADTGVNGSTLAPRAGSTENPDGRDHVMELVESFNLSRSGTVDFSIWADDTADLYFEGELKKEANFTQDVCADGSIGCEDLEFFNFTASLGPGVYEFRMLFYQVGDGATNASNPFGGLYSGEVTVPEPTLIALFGIGLLGLFAASRRVV